MPENASPGTIKKYFPHTECPWELFLDLGGVQIRVQTNSQVLRNELEEYFKDFLGGETRRMLRIQAVQAEEPDIPVKFSDKPQEPGKTKIKEEFADIGGCRIIRKKTTRLVFLIGEGINLAYGPCRENPNQIINFINNRLIQVLLQKNMLLGHAAGIKYGNKGLALAGFSGKGKSTLALHLMSLGSIFISNDRLLLEKSPETQRMYGVPKLPRINPGTALHNKDLKMVIPEFDRDKFSRLSADELWHLEHKYDVYIDECFGPGKFELACSYSGLVLLNWDHENTETRMEQIDINKRRDLLPAFMKHPGLFYFPKAGQSLNLDPESYVQALSNKPVFEIHGGIDFDKAAEKCLEFLKK
ncbi:MAG: HprK-related kinase B [Desulfonatronovibrionaceae bacterium]